MARICLALLFLLFAANVPHVAHAQTRIVAVVNGLPVTSYDVSQRQKLLRLTGARGNTQEMALNELIDETIQRRAFKGARISVSDQEINQAVASIAQNAKISVGQLQGALRQAGVPIQTLKDRLEAQIGFNRLVRARFDRYAAVTEQDLVAALIRDESKENVIDTPRYTLHQILIALPENPSDRRRREANARAEDLRRKFSGCSGGLEMARSTRNVVVREFGTRLGVEFQPNVRELLDETPVGKLTKPFPQQRGLAMLAVCNKEMVRSTNAAMKELEPEMRTERGEAFTKQYMRQLRRDAVIERRG